MVCDTVLTRLDSEGLEGRARGKDDGAFSPLNSLLESALGLGEGVAEREQDGAAVRATLVDGGLEGTDGRLSEDAECGGQTYEGTGLDIFNDLFQGAVLLALVVRAGKVLLVLGKVVTTVLGDEALGVNEPELVTGLALAQTALGIVLDELLGNTDTGGASSHKDKALVLDRHTRQVDSTNVAAKNHSASALDVIVEASVAVPVAVEVVEGLGALKVLELDNHVGVHLLDSIHELVHELLLDAYGDALLAQTQVQGVLEVSLVVGASVENNGQSLFRVDACGGSIQSKLADLLSRLECWHRCRTAGSTYGNTNTIYTEVAEAENAGAVSDDADLGVGAGPVLQHGLDGTALLDGDVQGLGASVQGGVLQADIANGGSVYKRHELADVVHEKAVEQVGVLALEG